jgi:hypothetical protein
MTRLPKGLAWCDVGSSQHESKASLHIPGSAFSHCRKVLLDEDPGAADTPWKAKMVFGLTTDDGGRMTDVCLWSAELGDPVRFVSCMADVFRTCGLAMPPRMQKDPYTIWFFMD